MGIPGLDLRAQVFTIFYLRFLTLPKDQLKHVTDYLESGKPVVGFEQVRMPLPTRNPHLRQSGMMASVGRPLVPSIAFIYKARPKLFSKSAAKHPILNGFDTSSLLPLLVLYTLCNPQGCYHPPQWNRTFEEVGKATNAFGTHNLQKTMTEEVAWVWENKWSDGIFYTSVGHIGSFSVPILCGFL